MIKRLTFFWYCIRNGKRNGIRNGRNHDTKAKTKIHKRFLPPYFAKRAPLNMDGWIYI